MKDVEKFSEKLSEKGFALTEDDAIRLFIRGMPHPRPSFLGDDVIQKLPKHEQGRIQAAREKRARRASRNASIKESGSP